MIDFPSLIPIVNATGIPLLAIGVILLVRAYQKSVDTYKETSVHLSSENDRLRKRLVEADTAYSRELNELRSIVSKSVKAIEELEARKFALLSKTEDTSEQTIFTDVAKIDELITRITQLSHLDSFISRELANFSLHIQQEADKITAEISSLAMQIGDTKTRIAVVGFIASSEKQDNLKNEIKDQTRGLVPPTNEKPRSPATEENKDLLPGLPGPASLPPGPAPAEFYYVPDDEA
jgi:hypothetical protein